MLLEAAIGEQTNRAPSSVENGMEKEEDVRKEVAETVDRLDEYRGRYTETGIA